MKFLGVFPGNEGFISKNWEGVVEKVSARLSRWTWILPQLSYRGRALVVNNLIASMLWHRFTVVEPPDSLREVQRKLVNFFWGGSHWTKAAVLFLPVVEGGQGLIDLHSRVTAFRLQTVQRLLYHKQQLWGGTASVLLRKVMSLDYDKHLFLLELSGMDFTTSTFYQSVLRAWSTVLKVRRDCSLVYGSVGEEPLFDNLLMHCSRVRFVKKPEGGMFGFFFKLMENMQHFFNSIKQQHLDT